MSRLKILKIIMLALLVIAVGRWIIFLHPHVFQFKEAEKEINYDVFPFQQNSFFKKHLYPLKVSTLVNALNKPNNTYVDDNEGCPIGQLHTWHLKDQNVKLLVLGDCYKPEVDYAASTRLYAIRKINAEAPTSFEDAWGIKLGDSDVVVKEKLNQLIKAHPDLDMIQDAKGSPVHCHVAGRMKHQYVLSKDGSYLFFIINQNGQLETIMYTTIDVRAAC